MTTSTTGTHLIQFTMPFPKADVSFVITCTDFDSLEERAKFQIIVNSHSDQRRIKLLEDNSPQLADWAKGYARWLHRASIKAEHEENAIQGHFSSIQSPESALENIREACLMIRQRFEHYESSILM